MTVYACCEENRIAHALNHPTINGIRFLEVVDNESQPPDERQRRLMVHFIRPVNPALTSDNFRIEGGDIVKNIIVETADPDAQDHILSLLVDRAGDFSLYTLHLIDDTGDVPTGYDPLLAKVEFSFKINCLKDFDCIEDIPSLDPILPEPDISYLAKDFTSFRQLMLDRMAVTLPRWQQRNFADFGMVMVEMLSYVGDQLSAFQDNVSTEAYLATARSRVSVRRHSRLVDYFMHDGCNARTWVFLEAGADAEVVAGAQLFTYVAGTPVSMSLGDSDGIDYYREALRHNPVIFETTSEAAIFSEHNLMPFYSWGDEECCLPTGATHATLLGTYPNLSVGDLVLLEEIRGRETGAVADANPMKRLVVRLTAVQETEDPIGGVFTDGFADSDPVPITQIQWHIQDALPFPICISASSHPQTAVARGNIVLADHGVTITDEDLGDAPSPILVKPDQSEECEVPDIEHVPIRFRPVLLNSPLTQAAPYVKPLHIIEGANVDELANELDAGTIPLQIEVALPRNYTALTNELETQRAGEAWLIRVAHTHIIVQREDDLLVVYPALPAASTLLQQDLQLVMPQITLFDVTTAITIEGDDGMDTWKPTRDLINAGPNTREFVVEVENDNSARIRFGDDIYGLRPQANTNPDDQTKTFLAEYRVGNGRSGNIGAETLSHIVVQTGSAPPITFIRNPLSAQGGTQPESIEQARQNAPVAFRTQERAVTPEDYANITMRHPLVQRAIANFRWSGSWYTVFITVDLIAPLDLNAQLEEELRTFVDPFRMAGHDVEFEPPKFVPLRIEMKVCVKPSYSRRIVRDEIQRIFSMATLADGRRGMFHPDNFTFGQTVYLSQLYAAASTVDGIESLQITVFERQNRPEPITLEDGKIILIGREIARLDNDPNHPTNGVFSLEIEGGR